MTIAIIILSALCLFLFIVGLIMSRTIILQRQILKLRESEITSLKIQLKDADNTSNAQGDAPKDAVSETV